MANSAKNTLLVVSAILLFFVSVKLGSLTQSIYDSVLADDDRYYLPAASWLRVFSAGYNEVAADLVWVRTTVYFGGVVFAKEDQSDENAGGENKNSVFTISYLSTAAELDPKFRRLYTNGSGLTLFQRNGVVTKETVKATIDLLERGAREFPEDGEIAFQLGFMHYYEMEPFLPEEKDDPKRRFHKEHGARLIRQAALMDGVPSYAALLSTSLLNKEGLDDLMIEHLKAMLVKETNPVVRETLLHQLRREVGKAAEREIELSEKLVARWRANMPFVPFDIYVLIDRDYPVEELIDPLWWSNRFLGLVEESQDVDGVDTIGVDMIGVDEQDGDLP